MGEDTYHLDKAIGCLNDALIYLDCQLLMDGDNPHSVKLVRNIQQFIVDSKGYAEDLLSIKRQSCKAT